MKAFYTISTILFLGMLTLSANTASAETFSYKKVITELEKRVAELEEKLTERGLNVEEDQLPIKDQSEKDSIIDKEEEPDDPEEPEPEDPEEITSASSVSQNENILSQSANVECTELSKTMRREDYDDEVIKLQRFLEAEGFFNHPHITRYFGPVTEKALKDFQASQGIVSSGTPHTTGYGQLGPLTRETIKERTCTLGN